MKSVQDSLQDMILLIETAENDVRDGKVVRLSGLEDDVAALCRRIESGPRAEARACEELLLQVISRLETLAHELELFKARLSDRGRLH